MKGLWLLIARGWRIQSSAPAGAAMMENNNNTRPMLSTGDGLGLNWLAMLRYLKQYLPPAPYDRNGLGLALLPVLIAVIMLATDRYGLQNFFITKFSIDLLRRGFDANDVVFFAQVYFSGFTLVAFVLVPLVFHRIFPVTRSDGASPLGLSLRFCKPHLPVYALLLLLMLPVLWLVAMTPGFHKFYPMYKPASLGFWFLYELVYMLQFFAVEFFFRGFILFRLQPHFGLHAITFMVVPYALLHIHKPFPEALASIVAGLVLGMLALKSRSIWPGVVVHCGVAFSMDWFALIHSGRIAGL